MTTKTIASFLCLALLASALAFSQSGPRGPVGAYPRPQRNTTPPPPPPPRPNTADKIAPEFTEEWKDGNLVYRTYRSPEDWSGEGKDWSQWYTVTAGPVPDGYKISDVQFRLVGDRGCTAWAECAQVSRDDRTVTWKFRMQGHDENKHLVLDYIGINNHNNQDGIHCHWEGRKATSVGVLTIGFAPIE